MNKEKSQEKTLFSIEIKISGELVNIPVFENDTHQSLIERFCQTNAIKSDYQSVIKDKIIQSLLQIIKSQQMPKNLKDKIQKFVNEKKENEVVTNKLNNSAEKNKANKSINNKKSSYCKNNETPYNILHQSFLIGSNSPPNRHKNAHQDELKMQQKNKSMNCLKNSRASDNQLIKAYETIAKNCDDKVMKQMAKKFLKISQQKIKERDLNNLKRTVNVSQFRQNSSPKKTQNKSVNINKIVQQSRKLETNQNQNKSYGNLEKRYKYYRQAAEQSILVPELKSNLYYQSSKAFQRTPINMLYDNSVSALSRNIQSSSLGRTKKYRYITD